jgi:predicted metal-dependent phosphoesterase TrpH
VAWIHAAGGQAVLAHPARYKLSDTEQWALCSEFRDSGGVGIEVVTGSHSADEARKYAQVATEFGFLASRGSDFHGPGESRLDLGQLPDLPDSVVPIWHNWAPC